MIAVDWGTSSFRAWRFGGDGTIVDRIEAPRGALTVEAGAFPATLEALVGRWLREDRTVLMSGMVGSRQGWIEAPYVACPAAPTDLARSLARIGHAEAEVAIVPGVSCRDAAGVPDVMRGEETQIVGALGESAGDATVCLPGTHSKTVEIRAGRIESFRTHMTGEVFAALAGHTILGRTMAPPGPDDSALPAAFEDGVRRSGEAGGLLHHVFGGRARFLFGELPQDDARAYLSGMLIGHELRTTDPARPLTLVGATGLVSLYARACAALGRACTAGAPEAAALGLRRIARIAGLLP